MDQTKLNLIAEILQTLLWYVYLQYIVMAFSHWKENKKKDNKNLKHCTNI